jgi:hypothetical protein
MKNRYTKVFTHKLEPWEQTEQEEPSKTSLPHPKPADEAAPGVASDYIFALEFPSGDRQVYRGLPLKIGRSDQNDLVLSDPTVSGQHARLYYDEYLRKVCIYDMNSLNGVFIDDLPASRSLLRDGARIRLGAVKFIFRELEK